ncbi:hypothetical protein Pth03_07500 [Planotetraspora thailandica]|uniref:DUF4132 domain-containing protein n=2 Tax=Planotetraspora thailandica TaxID=487172 RepID=A0A8J3UWZ2_9ACTN|nr:hypothetical protein Pth03_07500 [Planotetraspora thailandica]
MVDETLASAESSASWLSEALKQIDALEAERRQWLETSGTRGAGAGKRTVAARRDMAHRLARTRGAERRAATICLASRWSGYEKEFALALSGTEEWTFPEVAALLTALQGRSFHWLDEGWLSRVVELAAEFDAEERAMVREPLTSIMKAVAESSIEAAMRRRLVRRIAQALQTDPDALPVSALVPSDEWAVAVRRHLGRTPPVHLVRLVEHAGELSAPRPTKTWRTRCLELLQEAGARELAQVALDAFGRVTPRLIVSDENVDVARGFIWAATLARAYGLVPSLADLALRTSGARRGDREELRLSGAAINALGDCDDPSAVPALAQLQQAIRHRALRKQIDTALITAAGRQGITPGQLLERSIPSHGLGPDGTLTRTIGEWTATLAIEDATTVRLSFRSPEGKVVRSIPAALKESPELAAVKTLRKEIRQTLAAERARVEGLFAEDRAWPYEEWVRHYRDHPVTGVIARGLIWTAEGDARFADEVTAGPVRLWHPAGASLDEVMALRETVTERRLRQPFKQAFREVYLLTPAERETRVYSNRFAAHIVGHSRLYAIVKERGWQTNWLGTFDGGYDAEARKELAEGGWRVTFHYEAAGMQDGGYEVELAATDQVRFERREGRGWQARDLAGVPPLVFSEAMRDVDLFIAVTSIAADTAWVDRGEDRYVDYWREVTFGELPPSAEVRRDALARILPRTAIADRCTLTERYLVVRGDLRTYKIHLGSANILMDPGDVYLCIVTASNRGGKVFLPFEEDGRMSLILSKAFLLAGDSKITDETILRQIRPRRLDGGRRHVLTPCAGADRDRRHSHRRRRGGFDRRNYDGCAYHSGSATA